MTATGYGSANINLFQTQRFPLPPYYPFTISRYILAQNGIENINGNISETGFLITMEDPVKQLSKSEYINIVQTKRREFVHSHFEKNLRELFIKLETEATRMRNCHCEFKVVCPDHFNVDHIELMLRSYFKDIGFDTISDGRKDESTTIILTLT